MLVALGCGVAPDKIVYSGVAKTDDEIDRAIGGARIVAIQVESIEEIDRVERARPRRGRRARASRSASTRGWTRTRVETHAHVATGHDEAKFGVARDDVAAALSLAKRSNAPRARRASRRTSARSSRRPRPTSRRRAALFERGARGVGRRGASLAFVDTGGGFGIDYGDGCAATPADFVRAARAEQKRRRARATSRSTSSRGARSSRAHGVLLARVIQTQAHLGSRPDARWLVIDAGMNDLLRPALYQARHRVVPLAGARRRRACRTASSARSARARTTSASTPASPTADSSPSSTQAPTASRWRASTTGARCRPRSSFADGRVVARRGAREPVEDVGRTSAAELEPSG